MKFKRSSLRFVNRTVKRLFWASAVLVGGILIGMSGYMIIEGYTLGEAFYMTIITLSTVGFEEVRELSPIGRTFTAFYILLNIGIFAFFFTTFSRFLFEGELKDIFARYMSSRDINKLSGHVIVCGYGRNGYEATKELKKDGVAFVVVDASQEIINERHGDESEVLYIIGDATDEKVLRDAGVERAKAIIAAVPRDSTNVFVALTARELNPGIKIIARATRVSAESKLIRAGVDSVVMPDRLGGRHMANLVNKPEVIEFLDMMNGVGELHLQLEEYAYEDFKGSFQNHTLKELNVRETCGVTFLGYKNDTLGYVFNPGGDTTIALGKVFIALGSPDQIEIFKKKYIK